VSDPSDKDSSDKAPDTAPTGAAPEAPKFWGGIPDALVKGGTTSWAHDQKVLREKHEAEERRRVADAERHAELHDGAKIYRNNFTDHGQYPKAYVLLEYKTERGEPLYDHGHEVQCLADIVILDPARPTDLALILVCPKCKERLPQDQCQIQIRQSNRMWHLDTRDSGKPIAFDDGMRRQVYPSAGTVMESEKFACPQCSWAARIDKNRVIPC
jgi:uncharacterized protein YbaR (Trm112 family)